MIPSKHYGLSIGCSTVKHTGKTGPGFLFNPNFPSALYRKKSNIILLVYLDKPYHEWFLRGGVQKELHPSLSDPAENKKIPLNLRQIFI